MAIAIFALIAIAGITLGTVGTALTGGGVVFIAALLLGTPAWLNVAIAGIVGCGIIAKGGELGARQLTWALNPMRSS